MTTFISDSFDYSVANLVGHLVGNSTYGSVYYDTSVPSGALMYTSGGKATVPYDAVWGTTGSLYLGQYSGGTLSIPTSIDFTFDVYFPELLVGSPTTYNGFTLAVGGAVSDYLGMFTNGGVIDVMTLGAYTTVDSPKYPISEFQGGPLKMSLSCKGGTAYFYLNDVGIFEFPFLRTEPSTWFEIDLVRAGGASESVLGWELGDFRQPTSWRSDERFWTKRQYTTEYPEAA